MTLIAGVKDAASLAVYLTSLTPPITSEFLWTEQPQLITRGVLEIVIGGGLMLGRSFFEGVWSSLRPPDHSTDKQ